MKKILSCLIKDPKLIYKVPSELFNGDDLSLYTTIKEKYEKGNVVDLMTLTESLPNIQPTYIVDIESLIYSINYQWFNEYTEQKIREYNINKTLTELNKKSEQIVLASSLEEKEVLVNELKENLYKINLKLSKFEVKENPEMALRWYEDYNKPREFAVKTGITTLDNTIGGLKGTELVIVMADTGKGKTNLLLNLAWNMLLQNKKILFFSLEMKSDELLDRLVPIVGSHNAFEVRERKIEREKLLNTIDKFKDKNLKIIDSGNITSSDVIAETINIQQREGVDVVMVDYLQRLSDERSANEVERLGKIARNLKNTALSIGVPFITPVQVDKASSKSGSIRVENVAWSKDIANEADLALYLHEKEMPTTSIIVKGEIKTFIKIVKSRHSKSGDEFEIDFNRNNLRMIDKKDPQDIVEYVDSLPQF